MKKFAVLLLAFIFSVLAGMVYYSALNNTLYKFESNMIGIILVFVTYIAYGLCGAMIVLIWHGKILFEKKSVVLILAGLVLSILMQAISMKYSLAFFPEKYQNKYYLSQRGKPRYKEIPEYYYWSVQGKVILSDLFDSCTPIPLLLILLAISERKNQVKKNNS